MDHSQRCVLRQNRPEIVRVLAAESDLNHVLDLMDNISNGPAQEVHDGQVVSESMRVNIRTQGISVTEKVRQFLDELERRGPAAYECFLEALKGQHLHLHKMLVQSYINGGTRKYVSGDDITTMGSEAVHINHGGPPKATLRSGINNTISIGCTDNEHPGMDVHRCNIESHNSTGGGRLTRHITICETQPNQQRLTDLAQMKWDENVEEIPESVSQLFDKKRKKLQTIKSTRSGHGVFSRLKLEKDDNVFVFIKQPLWVAAECHILAVNKFGRHVLLPRDSFKRCNDPCGEDWFFPINGEKPVLCEQQLYAILGGQPTGTYVVYKPTMPQTICGNAYQHIYNLSMCYDYSFVTYAIYEYPNSEVGFSQDEKYANICSLVKHHKLNRGTIIYRLRLPYSQCKFNIEDHLGDCPKIQLDINGSEVIIGIGYASQVKRVQDFCGKYVALKVPRLSDMDSKLVQLDFMEEVKHMLAFKHENIVRSLGVHLTNGLPHIVMEYLVSGDVQRCLLEGTLSSDDIPTMVEICAQTLSALAYLKQRQVIHRDVAARNVLVASIHPINVKLTDFGMSRLVRTDCYMADKNEVLALRWAAPEVLTLLKYSSKSDIWAFGMFFYEVFSGGQEPYNTIPDEEVLVSVVEDKCIPEKPEFCPKGLYTQMTQCWKFDPDARPGVDGLLRCVRRNCRTSPPLITQEKIVARGHTKLENLYTLDRGESTHKTPTLETRRRWSKQAGKKQTSAKPSMHTATCKKARHEETH